MTHWPISRSPWTLCGWRLDAVAGQSFAETPDDVECDRCRTEFRKTAAIQDAEPGMPQYMPRSLDGFPAYLRQYIRRKGDSR